ncbi:MAG TPA: CHAT domain-containing protein, partial [Thermoanaerobaculia bacterium]|nr:CHAT domain-containing protein [Thermoanaerobaculia bacterium]
KNIAAANIDLRRARDLAEALDDASLRQPLRMRLLEVQGETLLATDPAAAARAFLDAIKQAEGQHSTYRAILHFKLAEARRRSGDTSADQDVVIAFDILREEAKHLLDARKRGEYENYWSTYFSRFREVHRAAIQRTFDLGDTEEAFVQDERARAYEPLYALLQGRSTPPGFQTIVTRDDLRRQLAVLPEDTIILQYLVMPDHTYVWVLTHGKIRPVRLPVTETQIEKWGEGVVEALRTGRQDLFTIAMRAIYAELFRTPLAGSQRAKRVVIVPDGPMHGLPFAALEGTKEEGYLLTSVKSIATDGSTSRYLYSLARDRQFTTDGHPSVLLTAATVFDRRSGMKPLRYAQPEVDELRRWYPQAEVLSGAEATVPQFLAAARGATIIHFAGHALPVPRRPWESQLLLASGELTAEKLMRELSVLERTRLVVLGACSTAGGQPVGPEGLAPLVRPLIAANIPAVVGTLWDVGDATAQQLLVSLHCHYRRGDDVAVALRAAQLKRLQNDDPAMWWAPYQVVGYAGSPYAVPPEKTLNESVCAQNSLQRPDGLHPE